MAGLDIDYWNSIFIDHYRTEGFAYNDVNPNRPVKISIRNKPEEAGFNIVGVHFLTGAENGGQHNCFFDVLDKDGKRINGAKITWWDGVNAVQLTIDKPANEAGTNAPMWSSVDNYQALGVNLLDSDYITGLNTFVYPGDDLVRPGNSLYHLSFYIVFQLLDSGGSEPPVDPPEGEDKVVTVSVMIKLDGEELDSYESEIIIPC